MRFERALSPARATRVAAQRHHTGVGLGNDELRVKDSYEELRIVSHAMDDVALPRPEVDERTVTGRSHENSVNVSVGPSNHAGTIPVDELKNVMWSQVPKHDRLLFGCRSCDSHFGTPNGSDECVPAMTSV